MLTTMEFTDDPMREFNDKYAKAVKLLPGWFVSRMMSDTWYFGLYLTNGTCLAISTITDVDQDENGKLWITADMVDEDCMSSSAKNIVCSPTRGRLTTSIAVDHIMYAVELAET